MNAPHAVAKPPAPSGRGPDQVVVETVVEAPTRVPAGRVLIVAPQPFYTDRGTPIAVLQCAQAMIQLGYAVDIATFPIGTDPDVAGVRCFRCANPWRIRHVPIGFSVRKILLDLTLTWTTRRLLRKERYAFIHAVEEAAFPAVVLGARRGVPVIYDMQSSLPQQMAAIRLFRLRPVRAFLEACERWLIRRAAAVACSAGLAARVKAISPRSRVLEWKFPSPLTIPPDRDVSELRSSLGIREDAPVVLYTGTFEPYQGLPTLVKAMPYVQEEIPGAVLVLVGANSGSEDRLKNGSGPNGTLKIVPRQPHESMGRYLSMASVLVSPRLYGDNIPLKIFDYLAAGRPIVATDIPPHRAVLDDSTSLLVAPRAPDLGRAIARVLKDPALADSLADSAKGYAADSGTWLSFVDRVDQLAQLTVPRA